jgi:hypothetical protein
MEQVFPFMVHIKLWGGSKKNLLGGAGYPPSMHLAGS